MATKGDGYYGALVLLQGLEITLTYATSLPQQISIVHDVVSFEKVMIFISADDDIGGTFRQRASKANIKTSENCFCCDFGRDFQEIAKRANFKIVNKNKCFLSLLAGLASIQVNVFLSAFRLL